MEEEKKSLLPFTEEELRELNFTPEELAILEAASSASELVQVLPEDPEEFVKEVEEKFNFEDEMDQQDVFDRIGNVMQNDPDFIMQVIASQELMSDYRFDAEKDENEDM